MMTKDASAITSRIVAAAEAVLTALLNDHPPENAIVRFRSALGEATIAEFSAISFELRFVMNRISPPPYQPRPHRRTLPGVIFRKKRPEVAWLDQHPACGWLLQHHANGYLREEALFAISDGPQSVFELCALVERMNDWAPQVRHAAAERFEASLDHAEPEVVAKGALHLLTRLRVLQRWEQSAAGKIERALYQKDVLDALRSELLSFSAGAVARAFRHLLIRPEFDGHLNDCALKARSPAVRAIAMETLLTRQATWFVGYRRNWVDKSMGLTRRSAVFESRPVTILSDEEALFLAATNDRSAKVRKIAADWLITHASTITQAHQRAAEVLAADRSAGVRSRAEYFLRVRSAG